MLHEQWPEALGGNPWGPSPVILSSLTQWRQCGRWFAYGTAEGWELAWLCRGLVNHEWELVCVGGSQWGLSTVTLDAHLPSGGGGTKAVHGTA